MDENLIAQVNKTKINFLKTQAEKAYYLNEYKENIIMALTESQINSGIVYQEIIDRMKGPDVKKIKMRRDIKMSNLKPYILAAEKDKIRYTLIDALDLRGEIALVIVSNTPFDDDNRQIILEDIGEKFINLGLNPAYVKNFGAKLCSKHYDLVATKLPSYKGKFGKLSFWDKMIGMSCPICKAEKD